MPSAAEKSGTRAVGRPTKYDPSYCDELINYMARGFSATAFAGKIRVSRQTLDNWANQHAEFFDALKVAQATRVNALEEDMLDADTGPKVTARIFALKNAAPQEWRDRIEHTGADGGAIQFERRSLDPRLMSPDQREVMRQVLATALEQLGSAEGDVIDGEFEEKS